MDCEEIPEFSTSEEEAAYWKELTLKYKQRYSSDTGLLWVLFWYMTALTTFSLWSRSLQMEAKYIKKQHYIWID